MWIALALRCFFGRPIRVLYFCMKASKTEQDSQQWQKTPVANLVRNADSGGYYARVRVAGKLI